MRVVKDLALVLSGGSYKVMFQIAILVFLEKIGVYPKAIFAISGGVPNALAFILKKAHKLPGVWFRVDPEKFYTVSWWGLVVKPIFSWKKPAFGALSILQSKLLTKIIDEEVNFAAILSSPITIWIGAQDLRTDKVKWFSNHDKGMTPKFFRTVVLASMRIPIFFAPIDEGELQLADAGSITNLPVGEAIRAGFTNIIAINALPRRLPNISRLDTWPEIEVKNTDSMHLKEGERHRQAIKETNTHVAGIKEIKKKLCRDCAEVVIPELDALPRSGKRTINFCIANSPSDIKIFKKDGSYGYPTDNARFELLGAGCEAVRSKIIPHLEANNISHLVSEAEKEEFENEFREISVRDYLKEIGWR